ncbi:type I polyketide synthase [Aspergillus novofumigatus IBT 16806]|uniref:Ketoacyl-synt-domain-containing protein n=1 Tax=Aspergillus novofumigatus (strain IBT 16806) TaxID=1392255 RepID=A0A2I1CIS3_ASPN1|nr:ketoacyl-synt-domain-containing protein [Aspergillus novofumigatus IBT 16806]PKX97535.1 ketoacyl-synt-domain-containing protein [Aspergillus novofumigatus IBT 16806]
MTEDKCMPIAIIGLGGRFPADASSPERLWELVSEGRSARGEVPKDRFNMDAFYHPHHERQGTLNVRHAHFMNGDIAAFDAPFFSITPAEAKAMDPQQRMALECTYEALENAGQRLEDVVGSKTSCYIGCFTRDYSDMLACDRENLPLYHGTGTGSAIMSNRISWYFDLKGPSISLDTACSSSLVALHLGCQSLRTGESEMSIVGGTNLILLPDIMSAMSALHFLSPDGKCQSFDHKANGYSRGEGAAVVILKPLHLALRDNDVIRAVIRGTAVNQDGNTPGITLPSATAQEALIRETYANAGLNFTDTAYVETHGTGTPAGDPVEAEALAATFGKSRSEDDPVFVGSIKTNIGHLEGGSGLAQVVKAVFALEKGQIPPSLWFERQNDRIRLEEWGLAIPTHLMPWPKPGLRRLSINSFGYGGTNAHCILDDAFHYMRSRGLKGNHNSSTEGDAESAASSSADSGVALSFDNTSLLSDRLKLLTDVDYFSDRKKQRALLYVWSSHEQLGIERTARMYSEYLAAQQAEVQDSGSQTLLNRFAYTLATRRSVLPWKSFVYASTMTELIDKLAGSWRKPIRSSGTPKVAFVFTGQGAQWYGMGRELCAYQVFRESLEAASTFLVSLGCSWSLLNELLQDAESSRINAASFSQPICTAVQVALVDLGEIAAAYAKGAITRESAWMIAYHRGRLSESIRGLAPHLNGGMLAVGLGRTEVNKYLDEVPDARVVVACINSHSSTTLSGDSASIQELERRIQADGQFARRLKVEIAYHSPHMETVASHYLDSLHDVSPLRADGDEIKMFSSVTGTLVSNADLGASYWVANLLNPVDFLGALNSLLSYTETNQGKKSRRAGKPYANILIEIGPHFALKGPIKQTLGSEPRTSDVSYLSVLQRESDACATALEVAGELFASGYPVDISRQRYWFESAAGMNHRFRKHPRKDLVGSLTVDGVDIDPRWRNIIRLNEAPWIEHHKVQGSILYPAAGMMVAAIEAMKQNADPDREIEGFELRDILIGKAIVVPADDPGVEMVLSLRPWRLGSRATTSAWHEFTLYTRQEGWDKNCSGLIQVKYKESKNPLFVDEDRESDQVFRETYLETFGDCPKSENPRQFYEHLTTIGLYYGDVFQNLIDIKQGHHKGVCSLRIPDTRSRMPMKFEYDHVIHPTTLDSIIQMALPATTALGEEMTVAKVPISIDRLYVSAAVPSLPGTLLQGYARVRLTGFDDGEATVAVSTPDWERPLVVFDGIKSKSLSGTSDNAAAAASMRKLTSYFHWQEDLAMLQPEEDNLLHNFYSSGVGCPQNYAKLSEYVRLLAHKQPDMKILEVGAGTGGATLPLLERLGGHNGTCAMFSSYTFTDISAGFFEKARLKLKSWAPFMTYARLNIEEDPVAQGLEEGGYDLIVASNVLHATRRMDTTLANVKKLLKPSGKLVLSEITNPLLRPRDHFLSVLVSSAGAPGGHAVPAEVLVVVPEAPTEEVQKLTTALSASLQARGARDVTVTTIRHMPPPDELKNKSSVTLLECDPEHPFLPEISPEEWDALRVLILESADVTWVSRGAVTTSESPFANLMTGMARSIRAENPQLAFTTVDLDPQRSLDSPRGFKVLIDIFVQGAHSRDSQRPDWEYAIRNERAMVPRILMEKGMNDLIATYNVAPQPEMAPFKQEGRSLTLSVGTPGRLDTLQFVDDPVITREDVKPEEVEIEVKGVGLNFKDIMVAMGQLPQPALGIDCSGVVTRVGSQVDNLRPGDAVMTWRPGAFSNYLRSPQRMVHRIPDGMSFGTAASLPVVYSTAHYALHHAAGLRAGESILIHGAAGGVGQAGIILAQHIGAEVFATVSSETKKSLLVDKYGIPQDHIFNSRDVQFAQGIRRMTQGRGVDVVLNSLAGEALRQSWHCIATCGRFVELGQRDIVGNTGLDMAPFIRNASFHAINMLAVLEGNLSLAAQVFSDVVGLLDRGIIRPVHPVVSMPFSKMEEAFRLMQTSQHLGKIVLEPAEDELVPCIPPKVAPYAFDPHSTYILAGGSGGLGRCLGRWMVEQGARHIVFLSRSGLKKPELQETVDMLQRRGARVAAYPCDVNKEADVAAAVAILANEFPPVKGDAIYQNMTHQQFMGAVRPKVQGSWNLHKYLPQDMDFYVLLSSSVGIAGSRGQGNYSAGNSFQDALAHYRQLHGQHGVSIDVGMVLGVGFLADNTEERVHDNTKTWSFIGIREKEFLGMVQAAITGVSIKGQPVPPQLVTGLGTGGMMAQGAEKYPWWFNDAKFAHLVQVDTHQVAQTKDEDSAQLQALLSRVTTMDAAAEIVCTALIGKLAKSMMMPVEDVEASRPVSSYGVDSLLAVELRGWIFTELQADVSVFDLLSNIPISSLSRRIVGKSKCIPDGVVEADN